MINRRTFLFDLASLMAVLCFPAVCRSDTNNDTLLALHGRSDENMPISDPLNYSSDSWNDFSRKLVVSRGYDPPYASRLYAYFTLAQTCAVTAVVMQMGADGACEPKRRHVASRVAASTAALEVLRPFFRVFLMPPEHYQQLISHEAREAGLPSADNLFAIETGTKIGRAILDYLSTDGADDVREVRIPDGSNVWRTEENRQPIRPLWGNVKPRLVDPYRFDLRPPPMMDTAEFKEATREVSEMSQNATQEGRRIVALWADAAGTSTPPGHWNRIACQLARRYNREENRALEATALMNLAMLDAGIMCWRVKYTYWFARPTQVNPTLRPLLKVPNFPAYPSGHSAFSAAAADVLSHFYPEAASGLTNMARQASESRIIAGLHYRFDCEEGLRIGNWVAKTAIELWQTRKRFVINQWL